MIRTTIDDKIKKTAASFLRRAACLAVAAASLLACACTGGNTETSSEVTSTEEETTGVREPSVIGIIADGKSSFKIVRPDENEACTQDALYFKKMLIKITGAELDIGVDFWTENYAGSKNGPEILIGACDRDETRTFVDSLGENGYGFAMIGQKLVIAGKNDSLTARALKSFENTVLFNKDYSGKGFLQLPEDFRGEYSLSSLTYDKIINSAMNVIATFKRIKSIPAHDSFVGTQGSATDGKYFYVTLHKKTSAGVETNKIVKIDMETKKEVLVGPELATDHHNDMCYDSVRNRLVAPHMNGKLMSIIDPETLDIVSTVDVASLPGTPWAIAYNESRDRYVIAAGGSINICDADFNVVSKISFHSEPNYTGQGMDCDDDYIYMPLSTATGKSTDNIIVIYSWTAGYVRTVHMNTSTESETMMNYGGTHYVTFNGSAVQIAEVNFVEVYN